MVLSGGAEVMASVTVGLGRLWPRAAGGRLLLQQATVSPFYLRTISILSNSLEQPLRSSFSFKPAGVCQGLAGPVSSWNHQQIRTKARGNEYQPNNRKRKRTHGWIKRISTPAGIEVILRRMLKGRKSLSH